jgi:hypothetical protein
MYNGYLSFGGVELLNDQRVQTYLAKFAPLVDQHCETVGLNVALGHAAYNTPALDGAPWYRANRPATADFYGLWVRDIQGLEGSTRETEHTELSGDGAAHTSYRHGSREIRVRAAAFALTPEAMNEGMTWLREVLAADACGSSAAIGCTGHQLSMYTSQPTTTVEANARRRTFYKVESIEFPDPRKDTKAQSVVVYNLEFTFRAGTPWAFTNLALMTTLDLPSGSSFTDPVGEDCSAMDDPYLDFINDPYFTAIALPPTPPTIKPPNILDITTWRRRTYVLPGTTVDRWGRVVPRVRITTGSTAAQFVRVRFYTGTTTVSGCGFDGEFLVSYIPANSVMVIDGVKREISVTIPGGRTVPGGHLLFGSDGRPFSWPSMGCQQVYTMTADIMPGQANVSLQLETSIRE